MSLQKRMIKVLLQVFRQIIRLLKGRIRNTMVLMHHHKSFGFEFFETILRHKILKKLITILLSHSGVEAYFSPRMLENLLKQFSCSWSIKVKMLLVLEISLDTFDLARSTSIAKSTADIKKHQNSTFHFFFKFLCKFSELVFSRKTLTNCIKKRKFSFC